MTRTDRYRFTRGILGAAALSLPVYLLVLWDARLDPLRSALRSRFFSNFFDLQARALMRGHLAVPRGSLSIEGFVVRGHEYTYFPPGPALLRIPVLLFTDSLDGRLTAVSMLAAWIVTAALTGMLLWRVRVIVRGDAPVIRSEIAAAALVEAAVLCGSVVLFLASLPWVYHEVYAWAIAMAVGAFHAAIGVLERPSLRRVAALGAFTLGAILCRATTGWACALTTMAIGVVLWRSRDREVGGRLVLATLAAGAVPLAIGIGINWAKFRAPLMFPLENQVWTSVNPQRRAALTANGGDLVSPNILWSTSVGYLRPDGIRFTGIFPWVTLPAEPAKAYGGSFLDQTYRTASITAAAPMLVVLALIGIGASFRRGASAGLKLMRVPLVGSAAILGGIMFYGYIAYRYTSEFMPLVIVASAVGVTVLSGWSARGTLRRRRTVVGLMAFGLVYGLVANAAFAVNQSRLANPGTLLRDYVILQSKISDVTGHPLDGYVDQSPTLPPGAPADHLHIVGDCEALFVSTGEPLQPWAAVEQRNAAFALARALTPATAATSDEPATVDLARFTGHRGRTLRVEVLGARRYRLLIVPDDPTDLDDAQRTGTIVAPLRGTQTINVRALTEKGTWMIDVDGFPVIEVNGSERDRDWFTIPVLMKPMVSGTVAFEGDDRWTATSVPTPPVLSCTRLLAP